MCSCLVLRIESSIGRKSADCRPSSCQPPLAWPASHSCATHLEDTLCCGGQGCLSTLVNLCAMLQAFTVVDHTETQAEETYRLVLERYGTNPKVC